jgi:hypothetical protein
MERKYEPLYKIFFGVGAALLCVLLLLSALRMAPADAQTQPPADTGREQELDARIVNFFRTLAGGDSRTAFEELLRGSPLGSPSAGSQSTELRNKVEELKTDFGEILNWERYEAKRIGDDIVLVRHILKYEQYPVIWTFKFYRKPSNTPSMTNPWVLIELHFDTNIL